MHKEGCVYLLLPTEWMTFPFVIIHEALSKQTQIPCPQMSHRTEHTRWEQEEQVNFRASSHFGPQQGWLLLD